MYAGKKAITQSGAPLRNVQNQQPATDAPGAGPADKKQTKKQQAAAKTQPAAADDTNANPADAQANNKAGAAGAKQRPKQGVAKILDKLKAKLQSSLPPTDPTAAAPKPLKLHALRSQLMNIALTCLSEHLGLSEGQAPTAGRLVCADDSVWRAELKGYADELLSEGRGAALPGQDSESVCAEMVRLAGDHLAEVNRHVESATDFVQRAQRAMGDDATATGKCVFVYVAYRAYIAGTSAPQGSIKKTQILSIGRTRRFHVRNRGMWETEARVCPGARMCVCVCVRTESLGVDTCAALHKAVESSRKVLSPSVARDWVIRSVHTAQDKGQGVHVRPTHTEIQTHAHARTKTHTTSSPAPMHSWADRLKPSHHCFGHRGALSTRLVCAVVSTRRVLFANTRATPKPVLCVCVCVCTLRCSVLSF